MQNSNQTISALEDHLGFWLRTVSNQVSLRFKQQLEQHDISVAEWVAMRRLYQSTDSTHALLMNSLGFTKGATSKIITKLEEKQLITRHHQDGNLRNQIIQLSNKGNQLTPILTQIADENDHFFFGKLSRQQQQQLKQLMHLLVTENHISEIATQ